MQAVPMQEYLLRMLGSGGALYELYSAVLAEPDLTAEERVDYHALRSTADTLPGLCEQWDATHKPPLNPAQLLGVSFAASPEQVSLYLVLACKLRSVWTVAWQHVMTTTRQEQKKERKETFPCTIHRKLFFVRVSVFHNFNQVWSRMSRVVCFAVADDTVRRGAKPWISL